MLPLPLLPQPPPGAAAAAAAAGRPAAQPAACGAAEQGCSSGPLPPLRRRGHTAAASRLHSRMPAHTPGRPPPTAPRCGAGAAACHGLPPPPPLPPGPRLLPLLPRYPGARAAAAGQERQEAGLQRHVRTLVPCWMDVRVCSGWLTPLSSTSAAALTSAKRRGRWGWGPCLWQQGQTSGAAA